MNLETQLADIAKEARNASRHLARADVRQLDAALEGIGKALQSNAQAIFEANRLDVAQAEQNHLATPLVDRLRIKESTLQGMIEGVLQVKELSTPLNQVLRAWEQPNGLKLRKVRVPIGVIGIIFESRPNVTIDAAVLCLKTGNAVILRGGSEAFHSNQVLGHVLQQGLKEAGLPPSSAQLVPTTDREAIPILCRQSENIDLMIPRGGHGLIKTVVENARMPVIKHSHGVCHIYVHAEADLDMAEKIVINAKCQRPGVCNALETLLIDESIASVFVPRIVSALHSRNVEVRGDSIVQALGGERVIAATEEDWFMEYLELILSIRVVGAFEGALAHLDRYGSKHSDSIITRNVEIAHRFLNEVDSATVYWNASTRFTDGGQFGFGAEIGISTDKIHARGPMGLEDLTSYKYTIEGNGQIRD